MNSLRFLVKVECLWYLLPYTIARSKSYTRSSYNEADFGVTNKLVQEVISLPMHTELDDEQIAFITELIKKTV